MDSIYPSENLFAYWSTHTLTAYHQSQLFWFFWLVALCQRRAIHTANVVVCCVLCVFDMYWNIGWLGNVTALSVLLFALDVVLQTTTNAADDDDVDDDGSNHNANGNSLNALVRWIRDVSNTYIQFQIHIYHFDFHYAPSSARPFPASYKSCYNLYNYHCYIGAFGML